MRAQLQRGQSRGGWGAAVTSSICILLVAQSCAAQNSPAPGTIRGTVADSSGALELLARRGQARDDLRLGHRLLLACGDGPNEGHKVEPCHRRTHRSEEHTS